MNSFESDHRAAWPGWWIPVAAVLLAALYLPTLGTRFDFIDDGNLVYASAPMPLGPRLALVWDKIVENYRHLGPFRPTLWAHWELIAELCGGNELAWRAFRLGWCALAAGMFLWLLRELRLPPLGALAAGAVVMWNPYRNEIWTSLTLAEGVAMPYALFALVCARRATGSERPWAWDLAGVGGVLMALGCKNTFAALVPAQVLLRVLPDGVTMREGWRQHGRRALLLSVTLAAPIVHFVWFKLNWHPGQYAPQGPSLTQLGRMLRGLTGAIAVDFLGAGLVLAALVQLGRRASAWREFLGRYRVALLGGLLLMGAGVGVYLPMDAMSGRYTMPGVWGLDLLVAVLLAGLVECGPSLGARLAWGVLGAGLVVVLVAGVGKELRFQARAQLLWQTLEAVESEAPHGATIAWVCGEPRQGGLDVEEGIHFRWHLQARGRGDLEVALVDAAGRPLQRVELAAPHGQPLYRIEGSGAEAPPGWRVRRLVVPYWGRHRFECQVERRVEGPLARRLEWHPAGR